MVGCIFKEYVEGLGFKEYVQDRHEDYELRFLKTIFRAFMEII